MRRRLAALGVAGAARSPRSPRRRRPGRVRHGWPVVLKAVRGGYDGRGVWMLDGPTPELVAELLAAGTPLMVEERGADAPRAGRAGGALAVRAGGGVAGGRDRAGRRQVRRGARPRARASTDERPRRPRSWRCGSPPSWASPGCSRWSCSRPTTGARGQRAGDAPAQLRALDDRGRAHVAVRAAPARGARLPAGRDDADRAGRRDGERAGRRRAGGDVASTSGCTTSSPGSPTSRCTSTARRSGRPARSGTSRRWATTWTRCGAGRRWPRAGSRTAVWADGWSEHDGAATGHGGARG